MTKKTDDPRIPKHVSITAIILTVIGVFLFIGALIILFIGLTQPLLGIGSIPIGLTLLVTSLVLVGFADIIYGAQYQTKLLIEILKTQLEIKDGKNNQT